MSSSPVPPLRPAIAALTGILLPIVPSPAHAATPAPDRPNILFILSDDQGYGELGVQPHRGTPAPTPNLDQLACEGVRFTHAYANGHVCAPSRAAFLTGRYPHHFGFHGNGGAAGADNGPLRGRKGQYFEGGIRVPAIFRWPGRLAAGQVHASTILGMDLLPTFLAAAGLRADRALDGVDVLPLLATPSRPTHEVMHWLLGPNHALRSGDWKYVRQDKEDLLFNLRADPAEAHDLAAREPGRMAELRRLHESWKGALPPRIAGLGRKTQPETRR